ncbi:MAG: DUF1192 domain-containing protein [Sneathiella sp.]|nr:DUF1192 domain-containing protein [Sneathiella sp.]
MASVEDDIPILNHVKPSFDRMSIDELTDYILELKNEIDKAESLIKAKQKAQIAASSVFKS